MSTEPKRTPDGREVKAIADLNPDDVLVDFDDGIHTDRFLTVRCVEPCIHEPGRYLVVFAGGTHSNVRGTTEVELATPEEVAAHERRLLDDQKRAAMRAGVQRLLDLIDEGLPLPAYFTIDASCMPDADSVRAAAAALGQDVTESLNGNRPQWDVRTVLAESPGKYGRELVEFRAWHLAPKAVSE